MVAATFEKANTYVFAEPIIRDRDVGGSNPLAPTNQFKHLRLPLAVAVLVLWQAVAEPISGDSHRLNCGSLGSVSCVRIAPRGLRIRVSHHWTKQRHIEMRWSFRIPPTPLKK